MLRLLVVLGAVSALDPSLTFHFVKYPSVFRRNDVPCQVCYGEFDCLSMEQCGYNAAAAEVLNEEDGMDIVNDALTAKVDSMMYDLVLEDSLKEYNECIPLLSSYSTCNKENICLGCVTCDCDETGRWNCSDTYKCSNTVLNVDHQVLASVVEGLKTASRYKRSYEALEESSTRNFFEDLDDMMYVSKPMKADIGKNTEYPTSIAPTTQSGRSFDVENINNLAFDDILNYDNLEQWIKSCEKDNNEKEKHENKDSHQFLRILKNIEEGIDDTAQIDNPLNVKLLKDLKKYIKENANGNEAANSSNDQPNSINAIITDTDDFDFEKQPSYSEMNAIATIVKRYAEELNVTTTTNKTTRRNETSVENEIKNITRPEKELEHIIDVVNMLINSERKEINHLNYVKDYLLKFLRKYNNDSIIGEVMQKKHNISDDKSRKHGNWKVDMLNFYMNNLKKDVKDTIRDIYAIQKLKNPSVVPPARNIPNLKPLLFALTSHYLKNSRDFRHANRYNLRYEFSSSTNSSKYRSLLMNSSENQTTDSDPIPQRRLYDPSITKVYAIKLIKRALARILVVIDNDAPSTNILSRLKPRIRSILNRIVIKLHKEPLEHLSIRDPNFNLTVILTNLTVEWQNVPVDVHKLDPAERLHNMKLLHLILSQGIDKLKDALTSIQFGYSRRMSFIDERVGKDLILGASKFLSTIDTSIMNFVLNTDVTKVLPEIKATKTMWHYVKNALSKSKNSMLKYFQKKFQKPKSFIVNDMVRKRLEEVNRQKFLEVMKKWQENFDNYKSRHKRAVIHYTKRMKNILPKYLRAIKQNIKVRSALHYNVNKLPRSTKVHADHSEYATIKQNNVHADTVTKQNKVHAEGEDVKIKSRAKLENRTEPKNLTTKRGVRTQSNFH